MMLKRLQALLMAVVVLVAAAPLAGDPEKKKKDGPDEPKAITSIWDQTGPVR